MCIKTAACHTRFLLRFVAYKGSSSHNTTTVLSMQMTPKTWVYVSSRIHLQLLYPSFFSGSNFKKVNRSFRFCFIFQTSFSHLRQPPLLEIQTRPENSILDWPMIGAKTGNINPYRQWRGSWGNIEFIHHWQKLENF